ncbi:TldD/PmbA family protein [Tranquillimonas alkanivorans]|uniref:PmbA protein n=1 Tax=Tranquillimonas alkanivorans TaxID=441119 RepID=A0A1I5U5L0_9RHOB|nr:TldD/PmbA family protein [Tranquillimonas alkanivorans]SFP90217.1 microcin-processing peptidase 1. Unknown type peptidase. MEROPS family U62 [Tranquillimonas alkanivorans]
MSDPLASITADLLTAALNAGAEEADAVAVDGTSISIDVLKGGLEHAERSEAVDVGLRVLMGKRQACVSASDIRPETFRMMAERAVAMAKEAPEDPYIGLAKGDQLATFWDVDALDLADPSAEPAPADLEDEAHRAEAAALAHEGIAQVLSSTAGYGRRTIRLSGTNGFAGSYTRTDRYLSCGAITGEGLGMERDYFSDLRIHAEDMMSPEEVGRIAAERTLQRANPKRPKTGAYPVIFDERIAASLIGHLLSATNGTAIARGSSWARDLMGQQVLPSWISLLEDPLRPRVTGSRPFDAEGLAAKPRHIVEDGVLKSWTLDLATGRKLGLNSTGNAMRSPSAPPSPGNSNIVLTPGTLTKEELLREMGTGLLVTSFIGATVNPNTGDWSRGASGLWIENGEPVHAVNEITLAGNLRDMLLSIVPANDARTHLSRVVPSLLVEGLTLAGD